MDNPLIMGILNVTPDSFFDGNTNLNVDAALQNVRKMVANGVDILDIGAMSSRPGAKVISANQEIERIKILLPEIRMEFPDLLISLDTVNADTLAFGLKHDVQILNDISAGTLDKKLIPLAAEANITYVLMHMQNRPESMQDNPLYDDVTRHVVEFMLHKMDFLRRLGLEEIVIDPGFGFGKSLEHNYELLKKLSVFRILDCPLLVGLSRKSMIYKPLDIEPSEALSMSSALHLYALQKGAQILRVHDVLEAKRVIKIYNLLEPKTTKV